MSHECKTLFCESVERRVDASDDSMVVALVGASDKGRALQQQQHQLRLCHGCRHDAPQGSDPAASDVRAIEALGAGLGHGGKIFVGTSGTLVLTPGRTGTEDDAPDPDAPARARVGGESTAMALVHHGIRSSVVRLAPAVHSSLDHHGFIPTLIGIARDKNVSAYVEDGTNRWPAVHTLDAARLFRLALEHGSAGARWHGAGDEGVPFRKIADMIAHQLGVPSHSIAADESEAHFGWLSFVVTADNPVSSTRTREELAWKPKHAGLIADLEERHYFNA